MDWREKMNAFLADYDHPAWGRAHARRVYALALELARIQGRDADPDILWAAAGMHDLGTFAPYREDGTDHVVTGARAAAELLPGFGFPGEKIAAVVRVIETHMFYTPPAEDWEAIVFREADILDFLGYIGIARILSITGKHPWAPNPRGAVERLQGFYRDLPLALRTDVAKLISKERLKEMDIFFAGLAAESGQFTML
ncbi:MAG: HD domain-containing protein [Solirubrobacterales bacterium]